LTAIGGRLKGVLLAGGLAAAALLLRLWLLDPAPLNSDTDGAQYLRMARALASGLRFYDLFPEHISAARGVLFPAFLALAGKITSVTASGAAAAQALLNSFCVLLMYWAGAKLHSRYAGLAAALLFALDPVQIRQVSVPMIESFYTFALLAAAGSMLWLLEKPSPTRAAACGLTLGAGLLCRSALLFLPPLLALALLLLKLKDARRLAALLLLSAYLPLLPWVLRNYHHFGELVAGERHTATGIFYTAAKGADYGLSGSDIDALAAAEIPGLASLSPAGRNRALKTGALLELRARPLDFLRGTARRLRLYLGILAGLAGIPCLLLALGALLRRPVNRGAWALAGLAAYFLGVHSFMSVSARYLYPLMPVVLLLAAAGLAELYGRALALAGAPARPEARPVSDGVFYFAAAFLCCLAAGSALALAREAGGARARAALEFEENFFPAFSGALPGPSADPRSSVSRYTALLESGLVTSAPLRAKVLSARGVASLLAGDGAGAAADLSLAVSSDPGLYEAYLSLAAAERAGGRSRKAEKVFDAALAHAQAAAAAGGEFTCEEAAQLKLMLAGTGSRKFPGLARELVSDYAGCGSTPGSPAGRQENRVYS